MARIKGNVITTGMRGTFRGSVIKQRGDTQYTSELPDTSNTFSTDNQDAVRSNFADAVAFAQGVIRSPEVPPFEPKEGQNLYNGAISYYCLTHKVIITPSDSRKRYNKAILEELGLHPRQVKAVLYVQKHKKITNAGYKKLNDVSKATATRDLQELVSLNFLVPSGAKGAGANYVLRD